VGFEPTISGLGARRTSGLLHPGDAREWQRPASCRSLLLMDEPDVSEHGAEPDAERAEAEHRRAHAEHRRLSQRDVDLSGRDRVAMARAALPGDPDAAAALAAGALGSGDPAVAGEAAAVLGQAASARARRRTS
jgi:hypothetical protein